jgi:hypothetical protein
MQFNVVKLQATATAVPSLKATAVIVRAGGVVATLKLMAETAVAALSAAIHAPVMAIDVQVQLLKAEALTGWFLKYIEAADVATLTDAKVFRLQRALEELADIADEARVTFGKSLADSGALTDSNILTVIKGIADEIGLSDGIVMAIDRHTEDVLYVDDPIGKALSTNRADTFSWGEGPDNDEYATNYFLEDYTWSGRPHIELIKGLADTAGNFTDQIDYIQFTKGLVEPLGLSETFSRYITRGLTDALAVTDDMDGVASLEDDQVMEYRKVVTDLFAVSDSVVVLMAWVRTPTDIAALSDSKVVTFTKGVDDPAALTDAATASVAKVLADATAAADSAAKELQRAVADDAAMTDATVKSANKNVEDVGATTDAAYNNMVKVLADSTSISETKLFSLSRPLSDSGAATDSVGKTVAPGKTDSASLTDAGAVRMQSYCDITYFAEDYVGITFTF